MKLWRWTAFLVSAHQSYGRKGHLWLLRNQSAPGPAKHSRFGEQHSGLKGLGCDMTAMPVSPELCLTTTCILLQRRCCLNLLFEALTYLVLDSWEALHLRYHVFKHCFM